MTRGRCRRDNFSLFFLANLRAYILYDVKRIIIYILLCE